MKTLVKLCTEQFLPMNINFVAALKEARANQFKIIAAITVIPSANRPASVNICLDIKSGVVLYDIGVCVTDVAICECPLEML